MNASSLENMSVNISNGWIIGCSILTFGMMTSVYLNCMSNIQVINMKRKYRLELKQIENSMNSNEKKNLESNKPTYLVQSTKNQDDEHELDDNN